MNSEINCSILKYNVLKFFHTITTTNVFLPFEGSVDFRGLSCYYPIRLQLPGMTAQHGLNDIEAGFLYFSPKNNERISTSLNMKFSLVQLK